MIYNDLKQEEVKNINNEFNGDYKMVKKEEIANINLETNRLYLKRPTMNEQYDLWNIQRQRNVYRYYMSIPTRFKMIEKLLNKN